MCQDYIDGIGSSELGRKYDLSPVSVNKILHIYNVPIRSLKEARNNFLKRTLNEDYFETIDTPEKAYWLGVMFSDGYISTSNKYTEYIGIAVQASDIAWLEKFKTALNYNGEIKSYTVTGGYNPGSQYVRLLIGSNKLVSDLKQYGITNDKSHIELHIPDILYVDDFVRGLIDGDGSLRKTAPDVRLCGCKTLLTEVGDYLGYKYTLYPDKSIWDLTFNRATSRILEQRLYENASMYLDRKYNIAKRSFNSPIN